MKMKRDISHCHNQTYKDKVNKNITSTEIRDTSCSSSYQENDKGWPDLPGTKNSDSILVGKSARKFSNVVKRGGNEETKSGLRDRKWEQCRPNPSQEEVPECSAKQVEKESRTEDGGKELKSLQLASAQSEDLESKPKGAFWKSKALKAEKKRAREEEVRRTIVAPKGQRVRLVNQQILEVVLNNNVSFVNRSPIPTLSETEFPTVEEARKRRTSLNKFNTEDVNKSSFVSVSRIRKRKDPIHVDLVSLIKHKPRRPECDLGRVHKKGVDVFRHSGNQLDGSNPEYKRGKMREVPKKKKLSILKSAVLEERALRRRLREIIEPVRGLSIHDESKPVRLAIHSRKFREYCDNCVTPRLNQSVKLLLKDIVRFQDRLHQRDPIKAFAKRRYVSGFREVKKQLNLKKVKLVIIAPDLEIAKNKGGIDDTIAQLKSQAEELEVMCLFALSRRELGYLTFKKVGVSCIGICNFEGSENNYQEVLAALAEARMTYQSEVSTVTENVTNTPDSTDEMIASLLSKLSHNESPFLNAIERKSNAEEK